jgi:hypothetical protein
MQHISCLSVDFLVEVEGWMSTLHHDLTDLLSVMCHVMLCCDSSEHLERRSVGVRVDGRTVLQWGRCACCVELVSRKIELNGGRLVSVLRLGHVTFSCLLLRSDEFLRSVLYLH